MILRVEIPGEPQALKRHGYQIRWGQPRPGYTGPVSTSGLAPWVQEYDPEGNREWKAHASYHLRAACRTLGRTLPAFPDKVPLLVGVLDVFRLPKSEYRKRKPRVECWRPQLPDADNLVKAVLDAAQGVVFKNDSQVALVVGGKVRAAQGEKPRVEITVLELVNSWDLGQMLRRFALRCA